MTWKAEITDIKDSFKSGRLIPFVGAGLSMCVPGFPSWNDLLAKLRLQLPVNKRNPFDKLDRDPLERAEFFCRIKHGRKGLNFLRKEVKSILETGESGLPTDKDNRSQILQCQKILVEKFNRVYTTNYDRLLENACELAGFSPFPIFSAKSAEEPRRIDWCGQHPVSDSPSSSPLPVVQIVKYHGDYAYQGGKPSKSIVVTEGDYYRRLIDLDTKDVLLMRDLIFYDFLFLGYSFRDMSVKYVFHQIMRLLEEVDRDFPDIRKDRRSFFVTTEEDESRATYLNVAYGVKTLCIQRETVRKPDGPSKLVFNPKLKPEERRWLPDRIELREFNDLFKLANSEPLPGSNEMDKLYEVVEDVFGLRKGDSPRSLSLEEKRLVEELAKINAFTKLRAEVMHACYSSFLNEIVTP